MVMDDFVIEQWIEKLETEKCVERSMGNITAMTIIDIKIDTLKKVLSGITK